jgi:hypothetical protein
VSNVDTAIAANWRMFVDTFDGATDDDATTYGLNDSRRARQRLAAQQVATIFTEPPAGRLRSWPTRQLQLVDGQVAP